MNLILAVVQRQDAGALINALVAHGYGVTRICSQGGFLREGNVTLVLGVAAHQVDAILETIRKHCATRTRYVSSLPPLLETGEFSSPTPIEVQVGGATVFVLRAQMQQL